MTNHCRKKEVGFQFWPERSQWRRQLGIMSKVKTAEKNNNKKIATVSQKGDILWLLRYILLSKQLWSQPSILTVSVSLYASYCVCVHCMQTSQSNTTVMKGRRVNFGQVMIKTGPIWIVSLMTSVQPLASFHFQSEASFLNRSLSSSHFDMGVMLPSKHGEWEQS